MVIDRSHVGFQSHCVFLGLLVDERSEWYPDEDELLSLLLILTVFSGSNGLEVLSLIFIENIECIVMRCFSIMQ